MRHDGRDCYYTGLAFVSVSDDKTSKWLRKMQRKTREHLVSRIRLQVYGLKTDYAANIRQTTQLANSLVGDAPLPVKLAFRERARVLMAGIAHMTKDDAEKLRGLRDEIFAPYLVAGEAAWIGRPHPMPGFPNGLPSPYEGLLRTPEEIARRAEILAALDADERALLPRLAEL